MKSLFLSLFVAFFLIGCSTTDHLDVQSAEKAFKEAKSYEDDERYEEALRRYDEIKNKFPYSQYAKESDLRIADVYFKKEDFQAAVAAYSNYKFLYPNNEQIPYASYQLALSYYNQLPSTIDRDLSKAYQAIKEFDVVITKYGSSKYAALAQDKKKMAQNMLAEKETYIADFYYKRDAFLSALHRYEGVMNMPAPQDLSSKAHLRAAICAFEIGEFTRGREYLNSLSQKFASSKEAKQIQSIEKKYGIH